MKKLFFIIGILFVLVSCSFQSKNEETEQYLMLKNLIEEEREEREEIIKEIKDLKKEIEAYFEKDIKDDFHLELIHNELQKYLESCLENDTFDSELKKDIKDEKFLEHLNFDRELKDKKYLEHLTFELEFLHKEL